MSVSCVRCGERWPRDPALEVECPSCDAGIGERCRRPSGHVTKRPHVHRDWKALAEVEGYRHCTALVDGVRRRASHHETDGRQTELFA